MTRIEELYILVCYGDIPHLRPHMAGMYAFPTLDAALNVVEGEFTRREKIVGEPDGEFVSLPDPEDDRIVIYAATANEPLKVVWHFSGWHWDGDAADLVGGPLKQGKLPNYDKSLYDICMEDY